MRLSVAIQTPDVKQQIPVSLLTGSFTEKLARAAEIGLDGVELMTADPRRLDSLAVASRVRENGLEVSAVGSGAVAFATGLTLLHPDPEKARLAEIRLHELINFAGDVGAPLVTIGSFRGWMGERGEKQRRCLITVLRRGAEYARSHGVRLALEPINRYEGDLVNTAEDGLALLEEVGHSELGLLLDTYHVNIEENSWTEPFHRLVIAGKLWHVHLGDNNRLPPGRGLIDFGSIVATLSKDGYDGYLSAELLGRPDPDTAAYETVAYMRSIMKNIR